jgi:hypothetical protein
MFNEKSEEVLPGYLEAFESIKEVDEEVSYSVDEESRR